LDDAPYGVGVGDEILSALFGRPQVKACREFADGGRVEQADQ